jgi:hypothetical protein
MLAIILLLQHATLLHCNAEILSPLYSDNKYRKLLVGMLASYSEHTQLKFRL